MESVLLGCIGWYVINECQSHRIEQTLSDKRRPMQENPLDDDELRCRKLRNLPVPQFQAGWLAAPAPFVSSLLPPWVQIMCDKTKNPAKREIKIREESSF